MRNINVLTVLVVFGLAVPMSGCGKAAEVATEQAAEYALEKEGIKADVDFSASEDGQVNFTATTPDGVVNISGGEGAAVPEGFPKDVPLPSDLKVMLSNSMSEKELFSLQGTTSMSMAAAGEELKSKALAQGWKEENATSVAGQLYSLSMSKDGRTLNYVVSGGDVVAVNITTGKL